MLKRLVYQQLEIDYPIFSVGMGPAAGPDLAATVSNAGACGVLRRRSIGGVSSPANRAAPVDHGGEDHWRHTVERAGRKTHARCRQSGSDRRVAAAPGGFLTPSSGAAVGSGRIA